MDSSMDEYGDKLTRIVQYLNERAPAKLSISAISRELKIHRGTTAKYLDMLLLSGEVMMVPFGKAKLYTTSKNNSQNMLLDIYADPIVIIDARGCIETANKKFFRNFGIPSDKKITGLNIFDLNLPLFSDQSVRKNIHRMINGTMYAKEIEYIDEGRSLCFKIDFRRTVSKFGGLDMYIKINDITDQVQRDQELTIIDKRHKVIFERSLSGIIMIDSTGSILNSNQAAQDIFGISSPCYMSDLNFFDLISDKAALGDFIDNGGQNTMCTLCDFDRLRHASNIPTVKTGVAYLEIAFVPIDMDGTGSSSAEFAIFIKDITAETNSLRELTQKEVIYRSLFDRVCNAMTILTPINDYEDYIIKDMNKAAEKTLRIKKEDAVGKLVYHIFPCLRYKKLTKEDIQSLMVDDSPLIIPNIKYFPEPNSPRLTHYVFKLQSGDIVSFILDISDRQLLAKLPKDMLYLQKLYLK